MTEPRITHEIRARRLRAPATIACVAALWASIGITRARADDCTAPDRPSELVAGDAIDHLTLVARSRRLRAHMTSGRTYCYRLFEAVAIPPPGAYRGNKSGSIIRLEEAGAGNWYELELNQGEKPFKRAWRRIKAPRSFRVIVISGGDSARGAPDGRPPPPDALSAEEIRKLEATGLRVETTARIAEKLENDATLTGEEARALLELLEGSTLDNGQALLPLDKNAWLEWARLYAEEPDRFAGPRRFGKDGLSPREVEKILAERKKYLGIKDPPAVTAQKLRRKLKYDPALRRSWNGLTRWERDLWQAYWKRLPGSTQGDGKDLSMTPEVRFRIALQLSPDYMGQGAREAARALFNDPVFIVGTMASITLYVVAILNPEPLISKATAAAITGALLTVFAFSEIENLVTAWFRLRERAGRARTLGELDAAASEFGQAVGGTGVRVLLALFTYFAGKALPAPRPSTSATPSAPAVVTSGGGAAAVRHMIIQGTRVTVFADGTVIMAPVIASVGASGAGGGNGRATDASANERHGDGGRRLTKVEKQIKALQEKAKKASGAERKKLEQKIKNIRRAAQKDERGTEHSAGSGGDKQRGRQSRSR